MLILDSHAQDLSDVEFAAMQVFVDRSEIVDMRNNYSFADLN